MLVFLRIAYFVVGTAQLFAVVNGIEYAMGAPTLLAFILSTVVNYIPLIGSAIGVYGAMNVWDWSMLQAGVLFFWYVPVFAVAMVIIWLQERNA
jgi:hypothetical protein